MWDKGEKLLLKDKQIGPLIKKYGHCRIKPSKKADYFTDLVESILSQQLSGKAAATIFGRVRVGLGGEVSPAKILKTKDTNFRSWGLSRQKTGYLKDLAKRVERGELDLRKLDALSDEDVIGELVAVKGIGRWTAEMFLMFSLARPDVFPADDLGIRNGVKKVFEKALDARKAGQLANTWKPFRTLASWYIWESLDNR